MALLTSLIGAGGGSPGLKRMLIQEDDAMTISDVPPGASRTDTSNGTITLLTGISTENFGVLDLSTSTSEVGKTSWCTSDVGVVGDPTFGSGKKIIWESYIMIPTLSTGSEEFICRIGMHDNWSFASSVAEGAYFQYDRTSSVNWEICTAEASTRTETASTIAVGTGWVLLRIVVEADGSSAEYFVDGVSAGTVTTNITTSGVAGFSKNAAYITKTTGTTARSLYVDYYRFEMLTNNVRY